MQNTPRSARAIALGVALANSICLVSCQAFQALPHSNGCTISVESLNKDISRSPLSPRGINSLSTLSSHSFGMHVNKAADLPTLTSQAGTIRFWDNGTDWISICPQPTACDWSTFQTYLSYASEHCLDVIYTFGRVPLWENPSGPTYRHAWATNVANIDDWKSFVTQVVQHSNGRIKYWELWNEPNVLGFWSGTNKQLIALAQSAYTIIKATYPDSAILLPPTSDPNWTRNYLSAGGGRYADIMTFHGYPRGTPEEYVSMISAFRSIFSKSGYSQFPIWDTEGNWADGNPAYANNPDEDAAWVARSIVLQMSMGVRRFIWYGWDFCNDASCYANLWTPTTGVRKPGIAYETIGRWLEGAFVGQCRNISDTVWSCPVTRGTHYRAQVMWNTENNNSIYDLAPEYTQIRDLLTNQPQAILGHEVTLGHKPVLVESDPLF
jgi:hypothetical protein